MALAPGASGSLVICSSSGETGNQSSAAALRMPIEPRPHSSPTLNSRESTRCPFPFFISLGYPPLRNSGYTRNETARMVAPQLLGAPLGLDLAPHLTGTFRPGAALRVRRLGFSKADG